MTAKRRPQPQRRAAARASRAQARKAKPARLSRPAPAAVLAVPVTSELEGLAHELRLTWRQRCFAEALGRDPFANQSRAARLAGCRYRPHQTGSRWASSEKVRRYLAAVRAALAPVEVQNRPRRCADLGETLELLTDQARGQLGALLDSAGRIDLEKVRSAPAGVVRELEVSKGRRRVKLESPQGAAEKLLRYHLGAYSRDREPAQAGRVTVNLAVLLADPALRQQLAQHARLDEVQDAEPVEPEPLQREPDVTEPAKPEPEPD